MDFTCITCKLLFRSAEEQKEHHKSEFHKYNLKRKVADLPPVSLAAFNVKVEAAEADTARAAAAKIKSNMSCEVCNRTFRSEGQYKNHLASTKHKEKEAMGPKLEGSEKARAAPMVDNTPRYGRLQAPLDDIEDELIVQKLKNAVVLELTDCLFCPHQASSFQSCLKHCTKVHSFFIPDLEYVEDLESLYKYLCEKIGIGNTCLWCNKSFRSVDAVQAHMVRRLEEEKRRERDVCQLSMMKFTLYLLQMMNFVHLILFLPPRSLRLSLTFTPLLLYAKEIVLSSFVLT
jgi:pre-60S factor REI1